MARLSGLAAGGHVLASLVLAGIVALIGLEFRRQIETQQGHIVGAILVLTGVGLLIWGVTGYAHPHSHHRVGEQGRSHDHRGHVEHEANLARVGETHLHKHTKPELASRAHAHEHLHGQKMHSHRHRHEVFIEARRQLLEARSQEPTLAARLAMIAVPFGVAASPDLTLLPLALAATAYGIGTVALVLGLFSFATIATFVGLTVGATAVGYQVKGHWLEENANTITAVVLIVIGIIVFIGL